MLFANTLPAPTLYCSVHRRCFIAPLQTWFALPWPHSTTTLSHPELTEASCDECITLARRTFQAQFPGLYTTSA